MLVGSLKHLEGIDVRGLMTVFADRVDQALDANDLID